MAGKFRNIYKQHLRNDAHFQFHTEFRDAVVRNGSVRTVPQVSPLWAKYLAAYTREDEGIKRIRKSALTERILTADRLRDDAFSGMAEQVNAHLKHFSASKRSAAERCQAADLWLLRYRDAAGPFRQRTLYMAVVKE